MPGSDHRSLAPFAVGETLYAGQSANLTCTLEAMWLGQEIVMTDRTQGQTSRPRVFKCLKNMTGGTLAARDVCSWSTTAGQRGLAVTSKSAVANVMPAGVVPVEYTGTIANKDVFWIQSAGPTSVTNSATAAIAAGDPLVTCTTAGAVAEGANESAANIFGRADAAMAKSANGDAIIDCSSGR